MKDYTAWIDKFMEGWRDRDVERVMETIAEDCAYYETVFDEPCRDIRAIRKLWEVVPKNQKDIEYSYEILAKNEEVCIIHFRLTRTTLPDEHRVEMDGIFQVSLDDEGKCTLFKQWRFVRELSYQTCS